VSDTLRYGTGAVPTGVEHARQGPCTSVYITLALILLFATLAAPASAIIPTANFVTNVTTGNHPFAVSFTDSSTNSPDYWNWSFGDTTWFNTTDPAASSPVHTYTGAGNFTVSLTATNADGSTTDTVADCITADPATALFSTLDRAGAAPYAVEFTDSSSNAEWRNLSFGDGTWSNTTIAAPATSHTYLNMGWYNVTLIANNTYSTGQMIRTQYINVAAGGTSASSDIPGVAIVAPAWTMEPDLNQSDIPGTLTVSGNSATITNPSSSLASAVFHYNPLTIDANGNISGSHTSANLTTIPVIANLAGIGTMSVQVVLNIEKYRTGQAISILMSGAPSTGDASAFSAAADPTRPLENLNYEIEITTVPSTYPFLQSADIYFTVNRTWADSHGPDNIRLFRIHDSPYSVTLLPVTFISNDSTTATFRATTDGFSRFSPGAISPLPSPASPSSPSYSYVATGSDSDGPSTGGKTVVAEEPKAVIVPIVEPPKEVPQPEVPAASQNNPAAPAAKNLEVPAQAPAVSPATGPAATPSFEGSVVSALQEGGARAAGFVTGERGPLPADAILPPGAKPLGAVAAGVAMAGAVALAGNAGASASGGLLGSLLGRVFDFFQSLFKHTSDFIGDRLAGRVEDHTAELLERQVSPLSRSLDASRNPLIPGRWQWLVLGSGAVLYGIAFVVAERAGMAPVVIGTYILVSGLVIILHELVHHLVARRFVMKSELEFSLSGLGMTFFSAWFFGNVFSQPLVTKIPEEAGGDTKSRGIAMLAGPLVSLACALAFALLIPVGGIWTMIGTTGLAINLVQVVFSLLPFRPLDGQPVYAWNKLAWAVVFFPVCAIYLLVYLV
jgi:PKD repeat protein/Zn-dependent protease